MASDALLARGSWQSKATVQDGSLQLVRGYLKGASQEEGASSVVKAAAQYSLEVKELEREARLRRYFDDQNVSSEIDVKKLDVEANRLDAAIRAFEAAGVKPSSAWSFPALRDVVTINKTTWESKQRWFSGKAQETFHDVMGKANAHSNILGILPAEDKYLSVIMGSVKVLMKASVEHRKTSEALARALKDINTEVEACGFNCEIIKSEPLKKAVANLYAAIFLFYADAIEWYKSSSMRKARYSLHENFSNRFKDPLEHIKQLSRHVQRVAITGSSAEMTVTRLQLERLGMDLRAGQEGLQRAFEEERYERWALAAELAACKEQQQRLRGRDNQALMQDKLFRLVGANATEVLDLDAQRFIEQKSEEQHLVEDTGKEENQILRGVPEAETINEEGSDSPQLLPNLDRAPIQSLSAALCTFIRRGAPIPNVEPQPGFVGDRLTIIALEDWLLAKSSRLLCLEGPSTLSMRDSEMSSGAAHIVWSAVDLGFPSISFFCEALPNEESEGNDHVHNDEESRASPCETSDYTGLVFSLIHQLICLWPPILETPPHVTASQLSSLTKLPSYDLALQVLATALRDAPPMLLIVIDGLQAFNDQTGAQAPQLVAATRTAMNVPGKVCKALFTSSGLAETILPCLSTEEYVRVTAAGGNGARPGSGKMRMRCL